MTIAKARAGDILIPGPTPGDTMPAQPARRLFLLGVLALTASACSTTRTLEVAPPPPPTGDAGKYAALVIDAADGKILYQVNATAPRYPASLTKMMTLFLLFEALDQGRVGRDTEIPVSQNAARQPPTKMGFRTGETIDVNSAIHALCVKSANDVAVAVAEYLGGTEQAFAATMTARARSLGMTGTNFANASGLPDADQRSTARDMALLGLALRQRFGHHYHYFSDTAFVFRGRQVRGHNDMLGRVDGVDGIKTGYIRASGYNIVTSVRRGGRSLVIVVMGADSARARNDHVEELIGRFLAPPRQIGANSSLFGRS